ncbi:MAG: glycosyltransferase family 39 protein, partial [bacterium]|nr:glycosyltransferase family 39 protein [bacterium]
MRTATSELVLVLDARGKYDVAELSRFVLLLEDFDCVRGYRQDAKQLRLANIVGSVEAFLINRMLSSETRDPTCGWLAFRRSAVANFNAASQGDFCFAELSSHINVNDLPQADVPVSGIRPRRSIFRSLADWTALIRRSHNELWFPGVDANRNDAVWSSGWAAAGLFFAAVVLLFSNLSYPLVEPDETRYAEVSLEMLQRGDWVIPTIQGEPFLDKPPLLYWLTMVSYTVFGVSEWAARLPIALAALACVMSIYFLGRKLVGARSAWIGAALLLTCAGFLLAGRFVITDCLLASCTTICGLAAYAAMREKSIHWGWWLLACFAAAAGVLTKGPLALVLCGPPLVVAWWMTRNRHAFNWKAAALLTLIVTALAAPWYVLIHFSQQEFASHFYLKQYVARYVNAFDHKEPWWFYMPVLFVGMLPTSLLLPSLAVFTFSGKSAVRQQ